MHVRVAIAWPSVDPIALARTDGAWDTERDSHCSCCLHHLHEEEMLVWPGCTTSDRQLLSLARYIAFFFAWTYTYGGANKKLGSAGWRPSVTTHEACNSPCSMGMGVPIARHILLALSLHPAPAHTGIYTGIACTLAGCGHCSSSLLVSTATALLYRPLATAY